MARRGRIRIIKGGPYLVTGGLPLTKKVIESDDEGYPLRWLTAESYPDRENYSLCRCGQSKNKPYCDGSHNNRLYNDAETADRSPSLEGVKIFDGPELRLTDKRELCVGAGFCTRAGNIWNLTVNSDNPEYKAIAIQEAADCPSGRLVEWDKRNQPLEPAFELGIAVTEDQDGVPGPLWVMGGVEIEAVDGYVYEKRNRVTLCRCGKSERIPFCDGAHFEE